MALLAAGLLAGCAGSDENEIPGADRQPILLNAGIQQMTEGTRATTFDNATALQTEGSFTCVAYNANTTTEYISPTTVNWNSTTSQWEFNSGASHYYWPLPSSPGGAYPALDFFAYMPASTPGYITNLEYSATSTPSETHTITFDADLSSGAAKEFIFALALDQDKAGTNSTTQPTAGQVDLAFKHPFARVKFVQGTKPSTVTINSVSLSGVKMNGSFSYDGSTSSWSDQATTKKGTLSGFNEWFLAVPSSDTRTLSVNCTWTDWGDVTRDITATIPDNWAIGTSYTYTISVTKEYALKVDIAKFTEQW